MGRRGLAEGLIDQILGRRSRSRSGATAAVGIGVSIAAGVGAATWFQGRRPLPSWSGRLRVAGLGGPVEIYRDRWGVPAIFARDEADLFLAQGAIQAADRLFQMDLFRRAGRGRLAEIVGEPALASDRLVRVLGFGVMADQELELAAPETREILGRYSTGVNQWIEQVIDRGRLPMEFSLLGYQPEPWTPADCFVFSKLMALGLCGNWEAELLRLEIAERFGAETLQLLDDDHAAATTFPSQVDPAVLGDLSSAARIATSGLGGGAGIGSNNWVIAPERTASGGAILANDPHLDLSLPSLWHECVLRSPTFNVRGYSAPGTPGVVIGHNGQISWGMTNNCADVQDLFLEDIDDTRGTYMDTDGVGQLQVVTEEIPVKDAESEVLRFRRTRRGPILTDAIDSAVGQPISLRWDSLGPGRLVDSVLGICRATNWEEFRSACRGWTSPGMNMVYADTAGDIGYQFTGEVPIRAGHDGRLPLAGADPAGEWTGVIPFDDLPSSHNPSSGRLVTANDRVVRDDYPHFISREWMNGYRGARIRSLVDREDQHTVEAQADIQADVYSLGGRELVEAIRPLGARPASRDGAAVHAALLAWDYRLDTGSAGADAYRAFLGALQEQVFGYLDDMLHAWLGKSRTRVTGFWSLLGRSTPQLTAAIREGDTALLDHAWDIYTTGRGLQARRDGGPASSETYGTVGPRADEAPREWIPARTWRESVERALDQAGRQVASRGRGRHQIRFQHPLGVVPALGRVVNRGPWDIPGDTDTVWQSSRFASESNDASVVGPSMRMVVDMGDLDSSGSILAGGQSGHPNSPHYSDQLPLWRQGRLRPAPWTPAVIIDSARYTQRLDPA